MTHLSKLTKEEERAIEIWDMIDSRRKDPKIELETRECHMHPAIVHLFQDIDMNSMYVFGFMTFQTFTFSLT